MMKIEDFGKTLFTILSNELLHEENPDISNENPDILKEKPDISKEKPDISKEKPDISKEKPDISKEKPDISKEKPDISKENPEFLEENTEHSDSNNDVSRSVLMLSYAYRPAFTKSFNTVLKVLTRAKGNPVIYVRTFAKYLNNKYSPLKFLILCSFISEIFLFLSEEEKRKVFKRKQPYVQQTTEALNDVFQMIFKKDFPQSGWTDIQKKASKIARGFVFLEPFMNKESPNTTVDQVARKILDDSYEFENKNQQIDMMSVYPLPQTVSINTLYNQSPVNLLQEPVLSGYGFPTNQTTYIAQNLAYPPFTFGTVDDDAEISHFLHYSGDQNNAEIFVNEPSGTKPNYPKVVETTDSSSSNKQSQENLTRGCSEVEPEPSFRTVKINENGLRETCTANDTDSAFLISQYCDDQRRTFFSPSSETESTPCVIGVDFQDYIDCRSETFSKDDDVNDHEGETSPKENMNDPEDETFPKENMNYLESAIVLNDPEVQIVPNKNENQPVRETFPKEEHLGGPSSEKFPKEDNVDCPVSEDVTNHFKGKKLHEVGRVNDLKSDKSSKEGTANGPKEEKLPNVTMCDPNSEKLPKEEIVNDSGEKTYLEKEIILKGVNVVNTPGNQPETFYQKQSINTDQNFASNGTVSSQKDNGKQSNKIEINFQTDEKNISAKELHLNQGGKKIVFRMPVDVPFIFKYNGRTSNSKQPET